jgi:PAS domain S-box-containing protein
LERLRGRVAELEAAEARRIRAEGALRESEQLYRRLVETSPDSIVLAECDGRILMANDEAASLHGYPDANSMVGLNVLDVVPEEERPQALEDIHRILETGELRDRQHALLRQDGRSFVAEVTGSLIRDGGGRPKYIIYNGRDVTARIRMQRELVEAQKLESIGRLAGGIAHDFNNLLAVVLGNASLQLRNQDLPPKTTECLKDIVEAAERASSLTTQLLAYARSGLRRPVPSDLNKLVQAACDIVRPTLPKQVQLTVEVKQGLPPIVVDRSQIQQVIINLCMNAIQASPVPGEVRVRTGEEQIDEPRAGKLHIGPGRYVLVQVEDHGPGMDKAMIERIFEPFFTTKSESRGMGLPVSLGIVQSHSGRLLVTSNPGQGTLVTVWLPASTRGAENTSAATGPSVINAPHGTETILVVEPDRAVCRTAEQILASLGYCVVTRTDADHTLQFLKTNCEDVDLVVLNFTIPSSTGGSMLSAIHAVCPTMAVLLTSGEDRSFEASALRQAGAVGFVAKPFSVMSLAQSVRKILDDPQRTRRRAVDEP